MIRAIATLLFAAQVSSAQDASLLPEKLQGLRTNYEAAVLRATAPLTKTYVQELEKLRLEYTRAGNLAAATAADVLIKGASAATVPAAVAAGDVALANMNVEQFKAWLSTVVIKEQSGFKNSFTYDGREFTSTKEGAAPRVHSNVTISAGKIFIPFTSTNATIQVDGSRSTADVSYSTGEKIKAKIEPKTKG